MQVDDDVNFVSVWQPAITNGMKSLDDASGNYASSGLALGELAAGVIILGMMLLLVAAIISFIYFRVFKVIS